MQCTEIVLSLHALVEPDDEIEIIVDRRRDRALFDSSAPPAEPHPDRHQNPDVFETYASRVEDATGRIVSKPKELFARIKREVVRNLPFNTGAGHAS